MAGEDFDWCQTLLPELGDVLPAVVEEEMSRLRNVRLAEHGFFPFEEALSVYDPLDPESLGNGKNPELPPITFDGEMRAMVPVSPLHLSGIKNTFIEAASRMMDPLLLDRIRLEFAGLCNQILSAEGLLVHGLEVLSTTCRNARSP